MNVIVEQSSEYNETEIIIKCNDLDPSLFELIQQIRSYGKKVVCKRDQSIYSVPLETIIYFRHIDDKVLAHCRDVSHECKLMLHVIEKELENMQFVRISKSSILNLKFLERVKPLANGRYEAYLKNGEKLIINRKYVLEVKKKMGIF